MVLFLNAVDDILSPMEVDKSTDLYENLCTDDPLRNSVWKLCFKLLRHEYIWKIDF